MLGGLVRFLAESWVWTGGWWSQPPVQSLPEKKQDPRPPVLLGAQRLYSTTGGI